MSSNTINEINSSGTFYINRLSSQQIDIGAGGGLTTIKGGLTLPTGSTLTLGTSGNTSPLNVSGVLTVTPTTGNTLVVNSTASSTTTVTGNSISTLGGIGVTLASYFAGVVNFGSTSTFSAGLNIINGQTLNVGTSGLTSSLVVNGSITANGGLNITNGRTLNVGTSGLTSSLVVNGTTTANGGLDITTGQTLNVGTSGTTSSMFVRGTLRVVNFASSTTDISSNAFNTNGGIGVSGAALISGGITSTASTNTLGSTTFASSSTLNFNSNVLTNLGTGINPTDAVTKGYVDNLVQGLDIKQSVQVATTGPIVLATDVENGDTIDGQVLVTNQRILIKNQTNGVENGIYTVNATGSPTRVLDFASGASVGGAFVFVEKGTTNADSGWVCVNDFGTVLITNITLSTTTPTITTTSNHGFTNGQSVGIIGNTSSPNINGLYVISSVTANTFVITIASAITTLNTPGSAVIDVVNTNSLSFTQFSGAGQITAGTNLNKSGNTLSVINNPTFSGITTITDSTQSTTTSTGSLVLSGGLGLAKTAYIGENLRVAIETQSARFSVSGDITGPSTTIGTRINYGNNVFNDTGLTNNQTVALVATSSFGQNSYRSPTATGITVTEAANLYISNVPLNGTNVTFGNAYALYVQTGRIITKDTTNSTSNSSGAFITSGGIGISNSTDATSSTNGGTFTTAGGIAVAKSAFIGISLSLTQTTGTTLIINSTQSSTSNSSGAITIAGGIGISNATDATSATNGGTFTTAGGIAVAKSAFIGNTLNVGNSLNVAGTAYSSALSVTNGISLTVPSTTYTDTTSTSTVALRSSVYIGTPTITSSNAVTATVGATVYVQGAPLGGGAGPASFTNSYAMYINSGITFINTTTASNNATSGALIVRGGVGVGGDLYTTGSINSSSGITTTGNFSATTGNITAGGTLTVNSIDMTPSSNDIIREISITFVNNGSVNTMFSLANANWRTFKLMVSVTIIATTNQVQLFEIIGINTSTTGNSTVYPLVQENWGDNIGITFSLTGSTISYQCPVLSPFTSGKLNYRLIAFSQ